MDEQAQIHRLAAYRVHQSLVEKPLSIDKFWPLWSDKKREETKIVMDKEMFERIKKAHRLKINSN